MKNTRSTRVANTITRKQAVKRSTSRTIKSFKTKKSLSKYFEDSGYSSFAKILSM